MAAFLTSWASTLDAARELDASFSLPEARAGTDVLAALTAFNAQLAPADAITLDTAVASTQKTLSQKLDQAGWDEQLAHATVTGRATLLSEASIGGRAFLNAVPAGRTRMEPAALHL